MEAIWTYSFERWGVEQADGYVAAIRDGALDLAMKSDAAVAATKRHGRYRRLTAGEHFAFVTVDEGSVRVVRVLHQAMDIDRHLR